MRPPPDQGFGCSRRRRADAAHEHIDAADLEKVRGEAQAALDWLAEKQGLQAAVGKTQDPVLLSADVDKKLAALERFSTPIMSRPKPKPPAPEPAPEPAKPEAEANGDANGEAAPMEEDGEGAPEAAPKADDLD